ncbi:MAG: hypothetical protein KKA64_01495 [Nanoarchaeota archaeon]|nr:hypothetical protein [Nanoarchaeota archaeon]
MAKVISYVFVILGLLAMAMTVEPIKKLIPFSLPQQITNLQLMSVGGILIFIGIIFMLKFPGNKAGAEVPIYHKNKIVGYRRR